MLVNLQVSKEQRGIWRYDWYYPPIQEKFRLTLDEGQTPEIEIGDVIFKREDQNPTGSIKDRGLAYQISDALQKGEKHLVISSSGNAAIAAAAYCSLAEISLTVFISEKINLQKLKAIQKYKVEVVKTKRPISESVRLARKGGVRNLRPSIDPVGSVGYRSLAFEIEEKLGQAGSIFFPVSSGTTLVGAAEGFEKLGYLPALHAVQTTAVCPIASVFDKDFSPARSSLADALVARVSPRTQEVQDLISRSQGSGWVVDDEQIKQAQQWLDDHHLETSAEGAVSLAGFWKARKAGFPLSKKTVCLLTGRRY